MYEAVLENGDLSQLGVWWTQCFQYIDDVIAMNKLIKKRLTRTHSVECIMEMGDRTCMEADELLLSRIMSGAEPEEDCSVRTADFIRAAQVLLTHLLPHVAVGVASELILKLVGAQTSRDREIGMDEVRRPAHEKLATVKMLMDRIIEMMTPENAGVVLRWTLPLKGRHRYFIWNQLKDALRRNHWRMIKVRQMGRELGVEWQTSGGAIRVLPTREQATRFGSLRPDVLVMVPGHRELDFLGIVESIGIPLGTKTWRGPIHPIHRPTSWMQEHPMI